MCEMPLATTIAASFQPASSTPMRILIIEDEIKSADYLQKGLTESGYQGEVAYNGIAGMHLSGISISTC